MDGVSEQENFLDKLEERFPNRRRERLRRVAKHRSWRFEESLLLCEKYFQWLDENNVDNLELDAFGSLLNDDSNHFYITTAGVPVWIFDAGKWLPANHEPMHVEKWCCAMIESLLLHEEVQDKGITMIGNMSEMGWRNFDPKLERLWIDTIQSKVPLKMTKMILYRPGFVFSLILKIVLPWMKEKMRNRIVSVHEREELDQHIPLSDLPKQLDGELDVDFKTEKLETLNRWIKHRSAPSIMTKK